MTDDSCARPICQKPRTAEGEHRYCSRECLHISKTMHGPRQPALEDWTWLPRKPREVRVTPALPDGD